MVSPWTNPRRPRYLARIMVPATLSPGANATEELRQFPELTEMQEAFVYALLANGGKQKDAAIAAGYAEGSADVTASRLVRNPSVIRAMQQAAVATLGSHVPGAIAKLSALSLKAKSEYVQLEAARDILDRVGLSAPKSVKVGGSLNVSIDLS